MASLALCSFLLEVAVVVVVVVVEHGWMGAWVAGWMD